MLRLDHTAAPESGELFSRRAVFRIAELGRSDAVKGSDELRTLTSLLNQSADMYPGIDRWISSKVIPGLRSSERIAYVAYEGELPIASAVLKRGNRSKFCHLKIHRDFQDMDLGQMFFTQMTLEARRHAKEIYFTLPESLWYSRNQFFESFGFTTPTTAAKQYRIGEEELACSAPVSVVWSAVLSKISNLIPRFRPAGYSLDKSMLISIKPKYANQILNGTKLVEIRRRFSTRWVGRTAVLYASRPVSGVVGEAKIVAVTVGHPSDIWIRFGEEIGCSREEYLKYVGDLREVSAIQLGDVSPYLAPVSLSQMSHLISEPLRPPQSFCDLRLDEDSNWLRAVSVASLLHSRFESVRSE